MIVVFFTYCPSFFVLFFSLFSFLSLFLLFLIYSPFLYREDKRIDSSCSGALWSVLFGLFNSWTAVFFKEAIWDNPFTRIQIHNDLFWATLGEPQKTFSIRDARLNLMKLILRGVDASSTIAQAEGYPSYIARERSSYFSYFSMSIRSKPEPELYVYIIVYI